MHQDPPRVGKLTLCRRFTAGRCRQDFPRRSCIGALVDTVTGDGRGVSVDLAGAVKHQVVLAGTRVLGDTRHTVQLVRTCDLRPALAGVGTLPHAAAHAGRNDRRGIRLINEQGPCASADIPRST